LEDTIAIQRTLATIGESGGEARVGTQKDEFTFELEFLSENEGLDEFAPEQGNVASPSGTAAGTFNVVAGTPAAMPAGCGSDTSDPLPPRAPTRASARSRWRRRARLLISDLGVGVVIGREWADRTAHAAVRSAAFAKVRASTISWLKARGSHAPAPGGARALLAAVVAVAVVAYGSLFVMSRLDEGASSRVPTLGPSVNAPPPVVAAAPVVPPSSEPVPDPHRPQIVAAVEPADADERRAARPSADRRAVSSPRAPRDGAAVARTVISEPPRVADAAPMAPALPPPVEVKPASSTATESAPPEAPISAGPTTLPAPDPLSVARAAVGEVLAMYRRSYNALDALSVSTIWQGVDLAALRRAFSTLRQQNMMFDRCDVAVPANDRALAQCDGSLTFVPRLGDAIPQTRRVSWAIDFQRARDRWVIVGVSAR
jgi:hypothetical protein